MSKPNMFETNEYTEANLTEAIIHRWSFNPMSARPRWVVAVQVNNGAGFRYNRRIDAVVLDTWPSEGLFLHGLEIKVSRQDLRRELQNPKKAQDVTKYLDKFSIVAAPGVATLKMLPAKWGLYIPDGKGGLRARRKPLALHADPEPTFDRSFVAAFVRALASRSLSKDAKDAAYALGLENGKKSMKAEAEIAVTKAESAERAIAKFEEVSGLSITAWNAGRIGETVRSVMDGGLERRLRYTSGIRSTGEKLITLADELDELKRQFDEGSE